MTDAYLKLARKHGDALEFFPFFPFQFVTVAGELIKQMVDNVGLEDFHTQRIGHILCVTFDLNIKRQNRSISAQQKRNRNIIILKTETIKKKCQMPHDTCVPMRIS